MASQTVKFEYDASSNILFADDDYEISTERDVDAFLALYRNKLKDIGHKVWIVTGIDGLKVHAKVSDYYGRQLKELTSPWYLGFARWGTNPLSRMAVRTASVVARYDVNIHDTKEQAIETIERFNITK